MENTCPHSEGGLTKSFLFSSTLDQVITTQSCDQHMQEFLSVEQRMFICSTFVKYVPWKKKKSPKFSKKHPASTLLFKRTIFITMWKL